MSPGRNDEMDGSSTVDETSSAVDASQENDASKAADASNEDDAEQGSELRAAERLTINKEFESFDAFIHEYVTNISRSGVFVRSKNPLEIGTMVNLKFTVIMDDIETIEGVGEVVRVQSDPSGMGVVFRELSQYSQHLLERLLTAPRASKSNDEPGKEV